MHTTEKTPRSIPSSEGNLRRTGSGRGEDVRGGVVGIVSRSSALKKGNVNKGNK